MKKVYKIEVDCANCANKMEEAVRETEGIKEGNVNFMAQKLEIEFEEDADIKTVMKQVIKNCKKVDDDLEIFL